MLSDSLKVSQLNSSRAKIWDCLTPMPGCPIVPQYPQPPVKKGAATAVSTTKDSLIQPRPKASLACDTYVGNNRLKMQSHTPLDGACNFQCTTVSTAPKCLPLIKRLNVSWILSLHMCCCFSQIWHAVFIYITYLTFGFATLVLALLARVSQKRHTHEKFLTVDKSWHLHLKQLITVLMSVMRECNESVMRVY